MRYKILLFLCLLLVCTTLVSATEYDNKTSTPDNTLETHTNNNVELVKTDQTKKNLKSTPASAASIDDHEAECYYGGRITYNLQSQDNDYVDEGKVDLYVNNTKVATKNEDGYPAFDWMYST